jgi:hypothetical protein
MTPTGNRLDRFIREPRMEPRMARMRGVRAPHRRTAHTAHPPIRGCGVGCAVGGATPRSGRTGGHPPVGEGWPASSGEPQTEAQDRTVPQACSKGCHVIQRERPQPFPGMSSPAPAAPGAAEGHSLPAQPSSAVRRDARAGEGGRHSSASAPMAGGAGLGSGVGVGTLMGTHATRVPGEPSRWLFALVRTPAGRGHAHKPRVTPPRYAT